MEIYPGITMDSSVRFGTPFVAGTRVDVATVVGAVGAGESIAAVQEAYPAIQHPGRHRVSSNGTGRTGARQNRRSGHILALGGRLGDDS